MGEQNKEQKVAQLFIKIILYLLLAFGFFSNYFVEKRIATGAIVIFLSAIVSLIALTIVYIKKCNIYWALVSISPFTLMILFNLILLYYDALGINTGGDWGFFTKSLILFKTMVNAESITLLLLILVILIIVGLIREYRKKKRRK